MPTHKNMLKYVKFCANDILVHPPTSMLGGWFKIQGPWCVDLDVDLVPGDNESLGRPRLEQECVPGDENSTLEVTGDAGVAADDPTEETTRR